MIYVVVLEECNTRYGGMVWHDSVNEARNTENAKEGGNYLNRLRQMRKKRGLSQFDLAVATRIYPPAISLIENAKMAAFPNWRARLADALDTTVEELFPEKGGDDVES
jgi:DNA-binding XRE family transcriptional regulator